MSYPPLGYTYPAAAASSLASSTLLSNLSANSAGTGTPTTLSTTCCDTGRPIMADPHLSQSVYSCQYNSSLLSYPRVPGLTDGVYSSYATQGYVPFGTDPSAFYPSLNGAYDLKDNSEAWRNLSQPTACYPYDPTMASYPYGATYGGMDLNARRKNATRESTSTLKAWLHEHIKNPYPTKGEKIMLAIITKMTLTQVSTWFANARRRLKKENKMVWSPRNRCDEDGEKVDSDDDDDAENDGENANTSDTEHNKDNNKDENSNTEIDLGLDDDLLKPEIGGAGKKSSVDMIDESSEDVNIMSTPRLSPSPLHSVPCLTGSSTHRVTALSEPTTPGNDTSCNSNDAPSPSSPTILPSTLESCAKPKIWSLAHTATSCSPPPNRRSPIGLPMQFTVKPGQIPTSYPSAMNSLRQWVDGSGYNPSLGVSRSGLSLPSHPAYGLSAISSITNQMDHNNTATTSTNNYIRNIHTSSAAPPIAHSRPQYSLTNSYGYSHAGALQKLSNGLANGFSHQENNDDEKTAFKPVTKRLTGVN